MVRRHLRHSTFYPLQVKQLHYLTSIAAAESQQAHGQTRRYIIEVECFSCELEPVDMKGAVNALAWLVQHNRHKTIIHGRQIQ